MTLIKKIKHAKISFAKQRPNTKYATLNSAKSRSDTFVLWECSRIINFIFSKNNKMALPLLFILHLGRLFPIAVAAGTALARFVAKNPRVIGSTISIEAISAAIQSYVATEKEKIDVVNEIGKENPQLRADLFKNIFSPNMNIVFNILPYLVAFLIIYYFLKR